MKVEDSYMSSKFFFLFDQYKCGDRFESMYVFIWCMPPWYMQYGINIGYMFNVVFFFTICKKPRANILSKLLCSSKKQQKKIHNSIFQGVPAL